VIFVGCVRIEEYEIVRYKAPNWTSDGKIVFVEDYNFVRDKHTWTGTEGNIKGGKEILTLCEIDRDGKNLKQIVKLAESPDYAYSLGITSTSSAGEWVAIAMRTVDSDYDEVFVVKRDGTGLKNLGEGSYPDLSPDGKKIVYQKPNQGLWIKNIDGSGDRQIVADANAMQPAWSPDNYRIAYVKFQQESLIVIDTIGQSLITIVPLEGGWYEKPDWGPADSNAIISYVNGRGRGEICYLAGDSLISKQEKFLSGSNWKWSPQGSCFIGYDSEGYFVINRDGSNKWYLKP